MKISFTDRFESCMLGLLFGAAMTFNSQGTAMESISKQAIIQSSLPQSRYERILMTQLRDKNSSTAKFRKASHRLTELLVHRVIECLPTYSISIETPVEACLGEELVGQVEFVSVMRSGDALLDVFCKHFPKAAISKILVQRNEETAEAIFKYMKLSPSIATCNTVVITEPMIATGGTLSVVIDLLIAKGVAEEKIIIASILAAPEGLAVLQKKFPAIKVVVTAIDEHLNEHKYIVPGLGDFGDRYFGT